MRPITDFDSLAAGTQSTGGNAFDFIKLLKMGDGQPSHGLVLNALKAIEAHFIGGPNPDRLAIHLAIFHAMASLCHLDAEILGDACRNESFDVRGYLQEAEGMWLDENLRLEELTKSAKPKPHHLNQSKHFGLWVDQFLSKNQINRLALIMCSRNPSLGAEILLYPFSKAKVLHPDFAVFSATLIRHYLPFLAAIQKGLPETGLDQIRKSITVFCCAIADAYTTDGSTPLSFDGLGLHELFHHGASFSHLHAHFCLEMVELIGFPGNSAHGAETARKRIETDMVGAIGSFMDNAFPGDGAEDAFQELCAAQAMSSLRGRILERVNIGLMLEDPTIALCKIKDALEGHITITHGSRKTAPAMSTKP